jgi:hypothetical protein
MQHTDDAALARVLDTVREALRGLRFGSLTLTVQDGEIVAIDRTVKLRPATPTTPRRRLP